MSEPKCIWQAEAELGEGVRYDPATNEIWWVDILGQKIFCLNLATGRKETWQTPETVGCTVAHGNGDVLALFRRSIVRLDRPTGNFETVVEFPQEPAQNRFNDGVVAPDGSLWVCSMDFDFTEPTGCLYRVAPDLSVEKKDDGYIVANGPAFSGDGRTMYVNETMKGEIYRFDHDPQTGALASKTLFVKFNEGDGLPDGICVDAEGDLWAAVVTGGCVRRFGTDGALREEIALPSPIVTSVGFGGAGLDELYVTTGRILMEPDVLAAHPLSGSLFALSGKSPGTAPAVFRHH
ncbi:SMP-30/gluconolactonase/LRE family protein [Nitratireductor sp. XY-223]|uniref:SMP-30/gluconolactonase/LRE family protein n=1 Tax=Nitratireductor sp. XY-223 TaxID=2561926 RepID=UPI0010AAB780|nr:SMP-30/gluconolactonase/LRE family protein [Nitratireductor sp. XY-223]